MKQFNSSVHKSSFSSIFVKFAVCFLFLGLAYRLFSSSFVQFSPALVANNDELNVDKTSPPQVAVAVAEPPPPPPEITGDHHTSENGDWIPDPNGPRYTNSTCQTIESPQNCMTNGRPDFGYVNWRWKPRDCDLPKFDPNKFLNMMRHKSLAFIGDSIMRNHVQSLLCMLSEVEQAVDIYHDEAYKNRKWSFPSHHFTVSLVWSPYLTKAVTFEDDNGASTALTQLHLDELDPVWTTQYENHDYVIIAGGKWFLKSGLYYENKTLTGCHNCHDPNITQLGFGYAYKKALNTTLKFITGSEHKPFVLFRSTAPDHFENGEWNTGGYCNRTTPFRSDEIEINDTDEIMRRVELGEFERAEEKAYENGMKMKLFDATFVSLLRPDGHPGVYRQFHPHDGKDENEKVQNDCLHWCLPGPIDSWNDLVMEVLIKESE
ncbi:protein trichome birefringence-like 25 [Phtheirospermum japonicum]|uniref:Protein trichome birefringence-like 25 n=1 Tax=Phtheirospermum japonicum TaxID=374723 RepID=A0A830D7N6_9LAMI|nr:protein trichome birefringence-like 25 [Phtheirospermum japonicum]